MGEIFYRVRLVLDTLSKLGHEGEIEPCLYDHKHYVVYEGENRKEADDKYEEAKLEVRRND